MIDHSILQIIFQYLKSKLTIPHAYSLVVSLRKVVKRTGEKVEKHAGAVAIDGKARVEGGASRSCTSSILLNNASAGAQPSSPSPARLIGQRREPYAIVSPIVALVDEDDVMDGASSASRGD